MISTGNKILIPLAAKTTLKNGLIACDEFDNSTVVLSSPSGSYNSTTKKLGTHSYKFNQYNTDETVNLRYMLTEGYDRTIAAWIYFQSGASFAIEHSNVYDSGYFVVQVTTSNILIILRDEYGNYFDRRKTGLSYSGWKHMIFTAANNRNLHIYINNSEVVLTADDYGDPYPWFDHDGYDGLFLSTYPTYLDQYAVWNRVLTSTERATLYNSGNGLISSEW